MPTCCVAAALLSLLLSLLLPMLLFTQSCTKYNIVPGVFCLGEARAAALAGQGFVNIAYGTDTGALQDFISGMQQRLKGSAPAVLATTATV